MHDCRKTMYRMLFSVVFLNFVQKIELCSSIAYEKSLNVIVNVNIRMHSG